MDAKIRNALETDFKYVSSLANQIQSLYHGFRPYFYRQNDNVMSKEYYLSMLNDKEKHSIFVLVYNNEIIGYSICNKLVFEDNPIIADSKIYLIDTMCISEKFQGKGFGTIFINEIKKYAQKEMFDIIQLNVDCKNINAISFYKKNGFDEISKKMFIRLR